MMLSNHHNRPSTKANSRIVGNIFGKVAKVVEEALEADGIFVPAMEQLMLAAQMERQWPEEEAAVAEELAEVGTEMEVAEVAMGQLAELGEEEAAKAVADRPEAKESRQQLAEEAVDLEHRVRATMDEP
jgi:hypothetical protein